MTQALDNLTAAVQAEKTVEDSVVTLLTTLSQELQAALANAGGTPDPAVQAIADQITANTAALAAAVTANTPAAPAA